MPWIQPLESEVRRQLLLDAQCGESFKLQTSKRLDKIRRRPIAVFNPYQNAVLSRRVAAVQVFQVLA